MIEPYRPDAVDLNVAVRAHPQVQVSAVERPLRPEGVPIYGYAEKYLAGGEGLTGAPRELPADIPDAVAKSIREAATTIIDVAEVRGVPRLDFLWEGDDLWVNEINTIPGSLARYFWEPEGISFAQLLLDMIAEAEQGPSRRYSTEGADGRALRSAGSIAGKLA